MANRRLIQLDFSGFCSEQQSLKDEKVILVEQLRCAQLFPLLQGKSDRVELLLAGIFDDKLRTEFFREFLRSLEKFEIFIFWDLPPTSLMV